MRAERFELASGADASKLAAEIRALAPPPADVSEAVGRIVEDVRLRGDAAVAEWTRRFDGDRLPPAFAAEGDRRAQLQSLDPEVRAGLELAIENVRRTAEAERREVVRADLP